MTLKPKGRHIDNLFVTGCTGGCQKDTIGCNQWREGCQYDDLLVSVDRGRGLFSLLIERVNRVWPVEIRVETWKCISTAIVAYEYVEYNEDWLVVVTWSKFFSLFVAFPIQPHAWRQTDTKSTKISGDKLWRQASQGCTTCLNGVINLCCVINIIPSDHIKLCTIHFDNYCVNWFSWPTIKHIWNALSLKVKKIINTHPSMNNHFVGQFTNVTKQCIPTSQTLCLPHPKPHQRYWKLKDYLSSQRYVQKHSHIGVYIHH